MYDILTFGLFFTGTMAGNSASTSATAQVVSVAYSLPCSVLRVYVLRFQLIYGYVIQWRTEKYVSQNVVPVVISE